MLTQSPSYPGDATELLAWQLVDSAFPTGGFAHSGGLEAAWQSGEVPDDEALARFVFGVLEQTGRGVLPLLNAAYRDPTRLEALDRIADAFLVNAVANRASRVQGRALAGTMARVWDGDDVRALAGRVDAGSGHLGPVMGALFAVVQVPSDTARRICLYSAARGVLAAAVRLGIAGSYDAQRLQYDLGPAIAAIAERARAFDEHDLAQTAPLVDLLQAAHDRLYSRLFQS